MRLLSTEIAVSVVVGALLAVAAFPSPAWASTSDSDSQVADAASNSTNLGLGFGAAAISVVFFGSNFVPVKKFPTADGMAFQWILCSAILIVGMIVNLIQDQPPFQPIAMIGGALWATGNILCVPIIKMIGLGLGMLLWGTSNLIMGWASGRFGLFGLKPDIIRNPTLNDVGVTFAIGSIFVYLFVKSDSSNPTENKSADQDAETSPLIPGYYDINDRPSAQPSKDFFESLSPLAKRLLGVGLSVLAGLFFGVNFDPPTWIIDNTPGASQNGVDYVFSHFCGIYMASTTYFLLYCVFKKNAPVVPNRMIFPAFISGVMWAVAQTCFFIANTNLSQSVSFPVIATGPGIVASLWGVLVFKEIKGVKNLLVLFFAFTLTAVGVALTAISK